MAVAEGQVCHLTDRDGGTMRGATYDDCAFYDHPEPQDSDLRR
ncbi:hypothetical protein JCM18899A_24450 [Nocardioides sp. AN3]